MYDSCEDQVSVDWNIGDWSFMALVRLCDLPCSVITNHQFERITLNADSIPLQDLDVSSTMYLALSSFGAHQPKFLNIRSALYILILTFNSSFMEAPGYQLQPDTTPDSKSAAEGSAWQPIRRLLMDLHDRFKVASAFSELS